MSLVSVQLCAYVFAVIGMPHVSVQLSACLLCLCSYRLNFVCAAIGMPRVTVQLSACLLFLCSYQQVSCACADIGVPSLSVQL